MTWYTSVRIHDFMFSNLAVNSRYILRRGGGNGGGKDEKKRVGRGRREQGRKRRKHNSSQEDVAGPHWALLAGGRKPAHLRDCSQSPGDSEEAEGAWPSKGPAKGRATWVLAGETEAPSVG